MDDGERITCRYYWIFNMKSFHKDIPPQNSMYEHAFTAKKISCQSEFELSEGSKIILRIQRNYLFGQFRKALYNHNLKDNYNEYEVFNEAYDRAINYLRKGKTITNLCSWYKSTGYNIIREYSKIENRQKSIRDKLSSCCEIRHASHNDCRAENLSKIIEKIEISLKNKLDVRIICLRVLDELSWEEVCTKLIKGGDLNCELSKQCIDRIKQRFHRAIKRIPKNL